MRRFPFIIDTLNKKNCTDLSGICFIYFFNKYYSMSMFKKKRKLSFSKIHTLAITT